MGKHGKGRSRKPAAAWGSQKKNTRDKGPDGNGVWNNFEPTKMQNELFEEYYKVGSSWVGLTIVTKHCTGG